MLVGRDGVKIADLGCAKLVGDSSKCSDKSDWSSFSGTPMFMAPEVVRGEEQGMEADVWALGCTIIEMATGTAPWPEETDPVSVLYRVGFSKDVPETPRFLSEEARNFLEKCLRRDPRERWTVQELLLHPFMGESESGGGGKELVFETESSPNGVLDRVFWESSDLSSISSSHIDVDDQFLGYDDGFSSSCDYASDRLKNLMMGEFSATSPDWTDHGDWVAVRSNEEEEDEGYEGVSVVMPESLSLQVSPTASVIDSISEQILYETSVILFNGGGVDLYGVSLVEDDSDSVLSTALTHFMNIYLYINLLIKTISI